MNPQLDESVHLAESSEDWSPIFEAERARLLSAPGLEGANVEHIGWTAVPGLLAKPIVDIQVGVASYPPPESVALALARLGYNAFGEAGVPDRQYFCLRGERDVNVHVVQASGAHWSSNIALRDHLRSSTSAREQYASAKRAAVETGAVRLEA